MRVFFVCRRFHDMAGGIERMATCMMNELDNRGHQVGLLTWDQVDSIPHYEMSQNISWYQLNLGDSDCSATWSMRFQRQCKIRQFVKEFDPDVIIAFQVGAFLAVRVAIAGLSYPVIAAERNSTDIYKYIKNGRYHKLLSNIFLTFSKQITVQMPSYVNTYPVHLRKKISVIPNPKIYEHGIEKYNKGVKREKNILCIGRLSYQKNHEFLLRSFSILSKNHPDWTLIIIGDGEDLKKLVKLKNKLSLGEQCKFIGKTKNVSEWYNKSSFLVLPSLWEGFPNVLLESFSHYLPAIGLETTSGVNELIVNGKNGLLSKNDEEEFADSMGTLIKNENIRLNMGECAAKETEKYKFNEIMTLWEDLFQKVSKNKLH